MQVLETFLIVVAIIALIGSFILRLAPAKSPNENPKALAHTIQTIALMVIVLCVLGLSYTQINAGQEGVLLQMGAVQGTLSPGPHLIMPMVQTVVPMDVRTQKELVDRASASSKDLQSVSASIAVNYEVEPGYAGWLYQHVGQDYKDKVIDPILQESLKIGTARYGAEQLIQQRDQVKQIISDEITSRMLAYHLKVNLGGVSITNFEFSPEFNQAIEKKQVAQQEFEQQKYVLQKAQVEAQTLITAAEGKAKAAAIEAQALNTVGGSKLLAREWIQAWKAGGSKVPTFVGAGGGSFMMDLRGMMGETTK